MGRIKCPWTGKASTRYGCPTYEPSQPYKGETIQYQSISLTRNKKNVLIGLMETGILIPCQSPWNTPLLPVLKPGTKDYWLVQDLREVNKCVETIHPRVPSLYTLLNLIPPEQIIHIVLDLMLSLAFHWLSPASPF